MTKMSINGEDILFFTHKDSCCLYSNSKSTFLAVKLMNLLSAKFAIGEVHRECVEGIVTEVGCATGKTHSFPR